MGKLNLFYLVNFFLITNLCYDVENYWGDINVKFNICEWQSNAIQQRNSFDCGLFVCIHALSFIEGVHFFQESSNNGREWVFYALSEYSKLKTQTNKNHIDKTNGLILNDKGIHKIKLRENEELEDPQ